MIRHIYRFPDGCAVTEDERLVEYVDLQDETHSGDIVLAKVDRMMPGIECAFADIGRKKDGFLPIRENSQTFTGSVLHSGDRVPVQIRREETGSKGAYLSRDLTIPGRYIILMPYNRYVGVSKRITDSEPLRQLGTDIAAGETGIVMRAASEKASESEVRNEAAMLKTVWKSIQERIQSADAPGEVLYSCDPLSGIIRDYGIPEEVTVFPERLRQELQASENRKVPLKCGGNLIIDRCEAMTVIDVNTSSSSGQSRKEATFAAVNREACIEAAIQVRLRNISGIILIDFIDMTDENDRRMVLDTLYEAFSRDRRKTVIHGWTRLGLMEITRKRI